MNRVVISREKDAEKSRLVKNYYSIPRLVSAQYATVTWTWGYLMTIFSCPCYWAKRRDRSLWRISKRRWVGINLRGSNENRQS